MDKQAYMHYIAKTADVIFLEYDIRYKEALAKVEENPRAFSYLSYYANMESVRYYATRNLEYARRARRALLDIGTYSDSKDDTELPVMDDLFAPGIYISAFRRVMDSGVFTEEDKKRVERYAANTLNAYSSFPEWGAHNRAAARAHNLLLGAINFSQREEAGFWRKLSGMLIYDSYKKWSIEDAGTYQPIWLNALINYAHEINDNEFYDYPIIQYYFLYFFNLICPLDVVPDYGDGRWGSSWTFLVSCFEAWAAYNRDGEMKYVAHRLFERMSTLDNGISTLSVKGMNGLVDAYLWADDTVEEKIPLRRSREVLDDVVGKKIIFESNGSYLLTNYRDEGNFAQLQRSYLRNTIPVEAEKAHHGHADENSIVCLISNGCVLLHDGGYRDEVSSSCAYRADYYHNRLVIRNGCPKEGVSFFDYIKNSGKYVPVSTQKIYFHSFSEIDTSRVRVADTHYGMEWDRCITFFKEHNFYLVVDLVQAMEEGNYTFGFQYFTRISEKVAERLYRCRLDYIGSDEFSSQIPNADNASLLLYFPDGKLPVDSSEIRRSYTQETSLHQWYSGYLRSGEYIPLFSLLIPDSGERKVEQVPFNCTVSAEKNGAGVQLTIDGTEYQLGFKYDMEFAIHANDDCRPKYRADSASIHYGDVKTDALYSCVKQDGQFSFICGSQLECRGKTLFSSPESSFLNNKFMYNQGRAWWEFWEESTNS